MEEILLALIQVAIEILGEAIIWAPWDFALTSRDKKSSNGSDVSLFWIVSLIIGILVGLISLILFPKVWITNSDLRVVNLVLAPLTVWFLADYFAARRIQKGIKTDARLHKVTGVCFSIGVTFIRFVFAVK